MSDVAIHSGSTTSWAYRALPALLAGGGAVAIALWNPDDSGVSLCVSKHFLGFDCPGCGGIRTVNSLMHGNLLGAADQNVLLALILPTLAITWLIWFLEPLTGRRLSIPYPPRWLSVSMVALVAAFAVVRNIDGPAWMQWLASGTYI